MTQDVCLEAPTTFYEPPQGAPSRAQHTRKLVIVPDCHVLVVSVYGEGEASFPSECIVAPAMFRRRQSKDPTDLVLMHGVARYSKEMKLISFLTPEQAQQLDVALDEWLESGKLIDPYWSVR